MSPNVAVRSYTIFRYSHNLILYIEHHMSWIMYARSVEADSSPNCLRSERIGVGTVESELERATKGSFSFQFETFSQMESALELIFSPSAASVILYVAAVKCGAHSYRRMTKRASTKEEILNRLSELKNDENWGKISFLDVDFANGSGRVIIVDSFETVARKTTQPCCHFFRGFLAGFLSELFEKTIEATEEKCAGKGDEHCEFIFG